MPLMAIMPLGVNYFNWTHSKKTLVVAGIVMVSFFHMDKYLLQKDTSAWLHFSGQNLFWLGSLDIHF